MPDFIARLLIVDDEAPLMKALCDTLQSEGYHATGFTSATEALATLRRQPFDLLLTDLMMPEMDGISVLGAAFEIDPNLVGIVMTGHGSVKTAVNALKTGALDYILKPFKLNAILPVLTRALTVRQLRTENIQLRQAIGLFELSMAIACARDPETVLQKVADAAFEQTKTGGLSVLLRTPDNNGDRELYVAAVRGDGTEPAGTRLPLSANLERWAGRCAESLKNSDSFSESARSAGIPQGVCIPMVNGGQLVGVLQFDRPEASPAFTAGQRRALGILASTGGSALAAATGMEQLRTAEERYRRLAEDAPDVVSRYELHPKAGCTFVNSAVLAVTGYAPEEYYSDPDLLVNIAHPDDRATAAAALRGELPSGDAIVLRWVNNSGADVWIEQRNAHVHDRSGKLIAIETVSRDITERRNLEERLRHSQKLEAIGKLTAGVAHDFNNLLTVINGYSALALQEVAPSTPTWSKLSEVKKAGDQAAGLTHQLLAFSRKQVLQPRAVNLDGLLQDMMQMIRRIVGDNVQVSSKMSDRIGSVKIDPTQVQQVILNLAVNARDAMPKGGLLHFELANAGSDEGEPRTNGSAPEGYVMLIVADTGCGMTPEVKQRVFEPFFTTKELGRGTGLGLATVHGIVEQSGGRISIDSEVGVGTKFTILFPRCPDAIEEPAARECPAIQAGHETILLVEDDDAIRALASAVLTGAGYRVLAAESGSAAIQLGADYAEPIDLLLTDMSMPGMTGSNLAQRLHERRPETNVLYMSGYTEVTPVAVDALNGAPEFLSKPFTPAELTAKVRKVIGKRKTVKRILVVDDEQPIRSLLKEILEGAGFEVFTASNGREAKHRLIDNPVDLVITDLIMPEMEGIEFIAAMRKERPHLKLIATTGGAGLDFLRAAHILGAHATLPKPLTPEALLSCVNQLSIA